ncbi:hypothetical protein ACFLQM_01005 [Acidobacteriota bacterium]
MNQHQSSEPVTRSARWLAPMISLAACLLGLAGAWLRPVWHDELYTLALARLPVRELVAALVVDSGPPLHYLLCHFLFMLVGWPEGSMLGTLMVRLPSVLAFAFIPWVVWKARPISNRGEMWGPLLVVAWLPLLYFGTEARAYALLALVNALLWIRGPAWIERGGRWTFCFAVLAVCLPLLHYTGFVSFLLLPSLVFFVPRRRRRALVLALALAALPALAWMPVMLGAPPDSMGWVATETGPGRPGLATVSVLAPAGPFPALFEASGSPVPPWASVLVLGTLIGGAVLGASRLRRNHDADGVDAQAAIRLTIALLPAVGIAVLALGGIPVYFAGRTESLVWALAAALGAILILGLRPKPRRIVAGSYVLVGVVAIFAWLAALPARPPAPGVEVGRELASMIDSSDRVVVAGLWQLEVRHGLADGVLEASSGAASAVDVETVPRSQAKHPGWLDREAAISPEVFAEAMALSEEASKMGSRIWLVWSPSLPLENTFFPAFAGWRRSRVAGSPIIAVDLLMPPGAGSGTN